MNKLNENKGFTVLEIILSLAIIEIIILSFISIFSNCFIWSLKSKEKLEALSLAQEYIEKIKADDIDTLIQDYNKKYFNEGKYTIETVLESKNNEFNIKNSLKIIVKVEKDNNEIINLQSYRKIR
ncbi:hypothetical protein [Tepidibacter formicigenes]|jgi:type II secretory pathway pseudopilin PulG|uniref:Prepilin-type N-terminal cleavage/methylation domain-containing protein n=1 Tax=Tepidibacter formicigenes DSM 15518 TaxID=1123349 RepID=A0A1M6PXA8_9FIRM|nr:hypothetical protein [Tepidibacter formicigenes]SHK12579.1 hypothetical protein SAMN02744037_01687 [Tepidibacter formicigenes DSM 15518]